MPTPRDIRRLAFQVLYQLDQRGEEELESIRAGIESGADDDPAGFRPGERQTAFDLALEAFRARAHADALLAELSPTWPAHRQPALDRSILRLAIYEMTSGRTGAKIVVNEAVELAKRYSTERSPAFVNGVLDKVLKRVLAQQASASEAGSMSAEQPTTGSREG